MRLIDADIIVEKHKKKIERIKGRVEILEKNKEASVYDLAPKIFRLQDRIEEYLSLIDEVENTETIEAEPVKHGRWVYCGTSTEAMYACSECGLIEHGSAHDNYCPNCGALMQGAEDD